MSRYSRLMAERAFVQYQLRTHADRDVTLVGWYWPVLHLVCDVLRFHHWERFH